MNTKDRLYFETKACYKPRFYNNKLIPSENKEHIYLMSSEIRNISKEALIENISPNIAKNEISKLIKEIIKLRDEVYK